MRRFPLPPIHRSTLVLAVLVFVLGIGANFGGDYHPPEFGEDTARMSFGWPWAYGDWERNGYSNYGFDRWTFWRIDRVNVWYPFAFVGNLLALLLIVTSLAALWEWRRRKVKHLWQFTLADILLGSLAVMAFYGVERWLCRDVFAEREFRLTLENPWMFDGGVQSLGIAESWLSHNQDVPADWFWQLFSIPETHRPYRRLKLELLRNKGEYLKMTDRQLELLSRCRNLWAFHCSGFSLGDVRVLRTWQQLRSLQLHCPIDDANLRDLPTFPQLQLLGLFNGQMTDAGVGELQRQPQLRSLGLVDCERVTGTTLSSLTTVRELNLSRMKLNDQGLFSVTQLPELRRLYLQLRIDPHNRQPLDWRFLAQSQQLIYLSIDGNRWNSQFSPTEFHEIDDAGLAAIATLPKLGELFVGSTLITDDGVRSLAGATKIHHLRIEARHGSLTDSTLDFFAEMKRPSYIAIIAETFSKDAIQHLTNTHPNAHVR